MSPEAGAPLLAEWKQGDFSVGEFALPFLTHDSDGAVFAEAPAVGVVLISQTCDVIKDPDRRPLVQFAALKTLPINMDEVAKGYFAQFTTIPALAEVGLLIDLDHIVSVDKTTVATWERNSGCRSTGETRSLASALARHKERFAFPDEFVERNEIVRSWLKSKRNKSGPYGDFVKALNQIRFAADWIDIDAGLTMFCLFTVQPTPQQYHEWGEAMDRLEELAKEANSNVTVTFAGLAEINALELLNSDRFDQGLSSDVPA